jgi:hypothetical protein
MAGHDSVHVERLCERISTLADAQYHSFRTWLDQHQQLIGDQLAEWRRESLRPSATIDDALQRLRDSEESACDLSNHCFRTAKPIHTPSLAEDLPDLQRNVQSLSLAHYEQFRRWIDDSDARRWSERIVEDVRSGVLNQNYGPAIGPLEWLVGEPGFLHSASSEFWHSFRKLRDTNRLSVRFAFEALQADLYRVGAHLRAVDEFRFVSIEPRMLAFARTAGQEWTWCWVGTRIDYDLRFCRSL